MFIAIKVSKDKCKQSNLLCDMQIQMKCFVNSEKQKGFK